MILPTGLPRHLRRPRGWLVRLVLAFRYAAWLDGSDMCNEKLNPSFPQVVTQVATIDADTKKKARADR